jgi:hypothetical protein
MSTREETAVLLRGGRDSNSLDRTETEMCVYLPGKLKEKDKEKEEGENCYMSALVRLPPSHRQPPFLSFLTFLSSPLSQSY